MIVTYDALKLTCYIYTNLKGINGLNIPYVLSLKK